MIQGEPSKKESQDYSYNEMSDKLTQKTSVISPHTPNNDIVTLEEELSRQLNDKQPGFSFDLKKIADEKRGLASVKNKSPRPTPTISIPKTCKYKLFCLIPCHSTELRRPRQILRLKWKKIPRNS